MRRRPASPILNGKFIARKNFVLPVLIMFLTQGLMTACLTEVIRFGYAIDKATVAAVAMSIEYLGMAIGTIVLGPMADKKEPKIVAAIALVFVAIGSLIMLFIGENAGILMMGGALFFVGLGLGGNTTIFMKVALSGVAPAESSSASGTFNVFKDMCCSVRRRHLRAHVRHRHDQEGRHRHGSARRCRQRAALRGARAAHLCRRRHRGLLPDPERAQEGRSCQRVISSDQSTSFSAIRTERIVILT